MKLKAILYLFTISVFFACKKRKAKKIFFTDWSETGGEGDEVDESEY